MHAPVKQPPPMPGVVPLGQVGGGLPQVIGPVQAPGVMPAGVQVANGRAHSPLPSTSGHGCWLW